MNDPESAPAALPPLEAPNAFWRGVGWAFAIDAAAPLGLALLGAVLNGVGSSLGYPNSAFAGATLGLAFLLFLSIGLSQWLWIAPMMRNAAAQKRPEFVKGLKTGAWIVFLLSASCFGLMLGQF